MAVPLQLVTVIPIGGGEAGEGDEKTSYTMSDSRFDLGEKLNATLKRLKEGSYAGVGTLPPIQQQMISPRIPPLGNP